MPVFDWQFVVVTLIAAGGLWTLVRRFVPAHQSRGTPRQPPHECEIEVWERTGSRSTSASRSRAKTLSSWS